KTLTSTNQYKNILGVFPKDWRVPMTIRRENKRAELLVRLMANQDKVVEKPNQPPAPGTPPPPPPPKGPAPKVDGERAKLYEAKKGYSNWYFNALERDRLLEAAKKQMG